MYTKEDFLRDHPPAEDPPYLLPWEIDQFIEEIARKSTRQGIEQGIEQGRLAKQRETILRILTHRFVLDEKLIEQISGWFRIRFTLLIHRQKSI